MLRPDRDHHAYDIYDATVKLARKGYGHEDVLVMLKLPKTPENKAMVRRIVLGKGWAS